METFLEHERDRHLSSLTLRNRKYRLTLFLDWFETHTQATTADRLTQTHLDAWLRHLNTQRTSQGLPIKPISINGHIIDVRGFLAYLAARGYVPAALPSTLQCVRTPKLLPQGALTHAQTRKLIGKLDTSTPEGYRNRTIIELLYTSGIRAAELLALDVGDVDFVHATAMVVGKGDKQRVVPIGRTALRCLETYLKAVRPFLVRDPGARALFLNRQGNRLHYIAFRLMVRACAVRAGVDEGHVTAHTFRRSCATELLRGGANMYHVKDLLGHETLNTLKHYVKLTIVDLKKTHAQCHPRERDED
jgi:integrase/recombinase XerD